MKRLTFVLAIALCAASCSTYRAAYDLVLNGPADAVDVRSSDGKVVEVDLGGTVSGGLVYSDRIIDVAWAFGQLTFEFVLENRTEHAIRLLWDGAAFVDPDGRATALVHGDVTMADRFSPQKPTVVPAGAVVHETVYTPGSVYYDERQHSWKAAPLLPTEFRMRKELLEKTASMQGREVGVLLPVECEGSVYEYFFRFKIDGVTETAPVESAEQTYYKWEKQQKRRSGRTSNSATM